MDRPGGGIGPREACWIAGRKGVFAPWRDLEGSSCGEGNPYRETWRLGDGSARSGVRGPGSGVRSPRPILYCIRMGIGSAWKDQV